MGMDRRHCLTWPTMTSSALNFKLQLTFAHWRCFTSYRMRRPHYYVYWINESLKHILFWCPKNGYSLIDETRNAVHSLPRNCFHSWKGQNCVSLSGSAELIIPPPLAITIMTWKWSETAFFLIEYIYIYLLNLPAKLPLSYRKVNLTFPFWRMVSILFGLKKLLERVSKMHSSWGWNSAKSDELDGGKWHQWLNVWGCHNKVNYVLLKCSLTKCPISGCAHTAPLTASSPRQLPKLMHWKVT